MMVRNGSQWFHVTVNSNTFLTPSHVLIANITILLLILTLDLGNLDRKDQRLSLFSYPAIDTLPKITTTPTWPVSKNSSLLVPDSPVASSNSPPSRVCSMIPNLSNPSSRSTPRLPLKILRRPTPVRTANDFR